MAVTRFKEIHPGRNGEKTLKKDGSTVTRYTRLFRAVTNSNYDEATVVSSHASCPRVGHVYPYDADAYCRTIHPRNEPFSKRVWIVTCGYSTEDELEENPLDDPAKIEWSTEQFQEPVWKDIDGEGIVNSAGDPYDPPLERDDSRITAIINKNLAVVPAWILTYADAVNDADFQLDGLTIPEGRAKVQAVRVGAWQQRNDVDYRIVTLTMHIKKPLPEEGTEGENLGKEWYLWPLDQGFREIDDTDTSTDCIDRINIRNAGDDELPTAPVLLDGSGVALDCPDMETAVFRNHQVYELKNFALLPLT